MSAVALWLCLQIIPHISAPHKRINCIHMITNTYHSFYHLLSLTASIETYEPVVGRLLRLWRGVLGRGISLQDASRFLKMMVINIFSIHHAADRRTGVCVCVCVCVLAVGYDTFKVTGLLQLSLDFEETYWKEAGI